MSAQSLTRPADLIIRRITAKNLLHSPPPSLRISLPGHGPPNKHEGWSETTFQNIRPMVTTSLRVAAPVAPTIRKGHPDFGGTGPRLQEGCPSLTPGLCNDLGHCCLAYHLRKHFAVRRRRLFLIIAPISGSPSTVSSNTTKRWSIVVTHPFRSSVQSPNKGRMTSGLDDRRSIDHHWLKRPIVSVPASNMSIPSTSSASLQSCRETQMCEHDNKIRFLVLPQFLGM